MKIKLIISTFLTLAFFVVIVPVAFISLAQTPTPVLTTNKDKVEDLQSEIEKLQKKLKNEQSREKTLASEIDYMNSQINLTELKIRNSAAKIEKQKAAIVKLAGDITDLAVRIVKLQGSIDLQQRALNSRLRARYKTGEGNPIVVVFGASTISQIIQRAEYLRLLELQDKKLLGEMSKTKKAYINQKDIFQDKKVEEEQMKSALENEKASLDAYRGNLEDQKGEKNRLLEITQNNEAKYQKLIAEAQKELTQITGAVSVLKNQAAQKVKKGDIIGTQGNSGYSSGDHLHFGVYKYDSFNDIDGWNWYYSNYVDPSKMLSSKSVYWDTGCDASRNRTIGTGKWSWPLSTPTVSQGFGHTCWSNIYYGGKDHPAYDMFGSYGSLIYAVEDGDAYFCRNCLKDGGNGVFIFHKGGYMTLYWHLR